MFARAYRYPDLPGPGVAEAGRRAGDGIPQEVPFGGMCMELINISSVRPGQVIAKAVTNTDGAVLCPPGFLLTAAVIERLRSSGVESVVLESAPVGEAGIRERLAQLETRFAGVDDPVLLQVKATIERRLQLMLMAGGA